MSIPENGSAWRVEDVEGAADCSSASLWRVGGDEVDGFLWGASLADLLSPEPSGSCSRSTVRGPSGSKGGVPGQQSPLTPPATARR